MCKRIRKKLRSEKGASITFALLLFLVCTVLSSVILAAATTAAGRMAKMAETDQKYYSVTSAAELIKDMFKGKTVTVERVEVKSQLKKYSSDDGGKIEKEGGEKKISDTTTIRLKSEEPGASSEHSYGTIATTYGSDGSTIVKTDLNVGETVGTEILKIAGSFPTDAALKLTETSQVRSGTDSYYNPEKSTADRTLSLAVKYGDTEQSSFSVQIKETIATDGTITFTIWNLNEAGAKPADSYQMKLVFGAQISESTSSKAVDGDRTDITATSYSFTTTTTTTTKTVLKWSLLSVE